MAIMKEAEWRPLGPQTEAKLVKKNKWIIHTMVGTLEGTDSMFRQGGFSGTESHFGTDRRGKLLQWQDTDFQADAQLEGNDDCISTENEDWGIRGYNGNGPVPPFTRLQLDALVKNGVWVCKTHSIPPRLIPNTLDETKGIGYHRQGIDPYRKHGEHYSTSFGKICPGDARARQVEKVIIPRIKEELRSGRVTKQTTKKRWIRIRVGSPTYRALKLLKAL